MGTGAQGHREEGAESVRQAGAWDLGLFAAVLVPGQMSPQATKYKETIRD